VFVSDSSYARVITTHLNLHEISCEKRGVGRNYNLGTVTPYHNSDGYYRIDHSNDYVSAGCINKLNISVNLKESVRLFLNSYVGYTDASKLSKIYLSIVEKSTSKQQLDENIDKITAGNNTEVDERSAEALRNLHERINRDFF